MAAAPRLAPFGLVLGLAACTTELDPDTHASALGAFRLDRVVVVVDDPTVGALSRTLEDAVLADALDEALVTRFGRFDGPDTYALGVKVQGYVLAQPGVPVLLAPRSLMGLSVNVYYVDPEGQAFRRNAEPNNLTVFESAGSDTVVGSGYSQTAEEQLDELVGNAAIEIERWMRENPDWFAPVPPPVAPDAAAGSGA